MHPSFDHSPLGDPGGRTTVSFTMLIDELTWGRYCGQPLPAALQSLLLPANTPPTTSPKPDPTPPDPTGTPPCADTLNLPGCGADRDGDPIVNSHPLPRLRLLPGDNTRDALRRTPLPTMNDCTFCKR